VTKLLRHGLLVEDGESHRYLRGQMEPILQKPQVIQHIPEMQGYADRILDGWADGSVQNMLVEMRRVALLIFMGTLLDVEFGADMGRLWRPILRAIKYISPGLWIVWPSMPRRFLYRRALAQLDDYLYGVIQERRRSVESDRSQVEQHIHSLISPTANVVCSQYSTDLLTHLVSVPGMDDGLIRDQLLTMLIAGHDTSTALLAWTLHLLGEHPDVTRQAQKEVDEMLGRDSLTAEQLNRLPYLDMVIKETLRLYPPIHISNRMVAEDSAVSGYELRRGTRLFASIYLSHRDKRFWEKPEQFCPERFARDGERPPPFTYVPFGGGQRTCIGASFAHLETKVVLARILQQFELASVGRKVRPHMGATLEPRPGVFLRVRRRNE
jgi:cytochrome P450